MIRRNLSFWFFRFLWVLLALVALIYSAQGVYYRYHEIYQQFSAVKSPIPGLLAVSTVFFQSMSGVVSYILSLIIFIRLAMSRRQPERMALYSAFLLLCYSILTNDTILAIPNDQTFALIAITIFGIFGGGVYLVFLFIFPDGRFVPRWSFLIPVLVLLWIFSWELLPALDPTGWPDPWMDVAVVLLFFSGGLAQAYRYFRVSTSLQRQQTKWIAFALIIAGVMNLLNLVFRQYVDVKPSVTASGQIIFLLHTGVFNLVGLALPSAVAISILRYRLWDIDALVNRALVYSTLSLMLGLIYFGGVVVLQSFFTSASHQRSYLAIVLSTLLIAGLFSPLRQRLQRFIDRRFFRRRYDALKTLDIFSQVVRDEVELERLSEQLLTAIEETIQPEKIHLWLRLPQGKV